MLCTINFFYIYLSVLASCMVHGLLLKSHLFYGLWIFFFYWLVLVNVSCKIILSKKRICSEWRYTYISNMDSKQEHVILFLFSSKC